MLDANNDINEIYLRYKILQPNGSNRIGYNLDDLPFGINMNNGLTTYNPGNYVLEDTSYINGQKVYTFTNTINPSIKLNLVEDDIVKLVGSFGMDIISTKDINSKIIEVENPFAEIFNAIDSAEDKPAAYRAVLDKLASDPNLSDEEKVALITLS